MTANPQTTNPMSPRSLPYSATLTDSPATPSAANANGFQPCDQLMPGLDLDPHSWSPGHSADVAHFDPCVGTGVGAGCASTRTTKRAATAAHARVTQACLSLPLGLAMLPRHQLRTGFASAISPHGALCRALCAKPLLRRRLRPHRRAPLPLAEQQHRRQHKHRREQAAHLPHHSDQPQAANRLIERPE